MRFIGITGGVGAGKSAILDYLRQKEKTKVLLADEIAHDLMEQGTACYDKLKAEFEGEDIWQENGAFDRGKLAMVIFSDKDKRERLNAIVHPAVKEYVISTVKEAKASGALSYLILEAALLVEEGYDVICDELWYIYASEATRTARLQETRGYSLEKIRGIFGSQLSEEEYRKACKVTIHNDGTLQETYEQIDKALRGEHV